MEDGDRFLNFSRGYTSPVDKKIFLYRIKIVLKVYLLVNSTPS